MPLGKDRLPKIEIREIQTSLISYHVRLRGGFLFDCKDNVEQKLKRIFEKASITSPNKQIILDYIHEPIVFLNKKHISSTGELSWFDFLHTLTDKVGFNISNVILLTSNVYGKETYEKWCKENSILNTMTVESQTRSFWISKLIKKGYKKTSVPADKKMSLYIGRPNFQKAVIVKWYLEKIKDTPLEQDIVSTFLFKDFVAPSDWGNISQKIKDLPGSIETGKQEHPAITFPWGGDPVLFSEHFARGLFNFTVDYLEYENFESYADYVDFKKTHSWWHEDMISEKTFKCILLKKPFIRLGMPGSLDKLRSWGFKTFDNLLFDETYDNIENFYNRLDAILCQIERTLAIPFDELQEKIASPEMQSVLEHNYNLAYQLYTDEELINV